MIGFVLITTEPHKEKDVYLALRDLDGVQEPLPLFGEYDIIVRVEGPDMDTIGRLVCDKIRTMDGVLDTKTLMGIQF